MIHWLLDDPAGIAVLTVVAATLVGGALWASFALATAALVTTVQVVRRRRLGHGDSQPPADV